MRFLPIFLDVTGGPVVLVGGTAAVNKLPAAAAHATVRWIRSPDVANAIAQGERIRAADVNDDPCQPT
jgi:hypothetical protein